MKFSQKGHRQILLALFNEWAIGNWYICLGPLFGFQTLLFYLVGSSWRKFMEIYRKFTENTKN